MKRARDRKTSIERERVIVRHTDMGQDDEMMEGIDERDVPVRAGVDSRTGSDLGWFAAARKDSRLEHEENAKEGRIIIVAQITFTQQHILASYIISQFIDYSRACV